jgi:protease IV
MIKMKNKKINKGLIIVVLIISIYLIFQLGSLILNFNIETTKNQIAIININGPITYTEDLSLFSNTNSIEKTINQINQAQNTDTVKGILFIINSPGGSVLASKDLMSAIKNTNKTSVSLIREVGASGAYWAASATEKIYADELSYIGSIGVFASHLNYNGLLERYNVTYERFVAGEYKDMGTPLKPITDKERELIQNQIDEIYHYFVESVAQNRNKTKEEILPLATGEMYFGITAINNGLIDKIGTQEDAINYIKKRQNITKYELIEYQEKQSLLDQLLFKNLFYSLGRGIGDSIFTINYKQNEINI